VEVGVDCCDTSAQHPILILRGGGASRHEKLKRHWGEHRHRAVDGEDLAVRIRHPGKLVEFAGFGASWISVSPVNTRGVASSFHA
jgi:hypothetical protein